MPAKQVKSVWETLSVIDCNDHTETKNGLTYLSWGWAWGTLKKHYPTARFEKMGLQVLDDQTALVCVRVWIPGGEANVEEVTEFLPVLDYKNNPVVSPNAFDVNSAYQRCLVKCLAYMGLGMYIYQGESENPDTKKTYEVKDLSGNTQHVEDLSLLREIFLKFMTDSDGNTSLQELRQFWAMNKKPLSDLEKLAPADYKAVYDAFMSTAEKLKETENGSV
jgi:hypothetical protein